MRSSRRSDDSAVAAHRTSTCDSARCIAPLLRISRSRGRGIRRSQSPTNWIFLCVGDAMSFTPRIPAAFRCGPFLRVTTGDAYGNGRGYWPLPSPVRHRLSPFLLVEAAILGSLGMALLFTPSVIVVAWPWAITPLLAQLYSCFFIGFAVGGLSLRRCGLCI